MESNQKIVAVLFAGAILFLGAFGGQQDSLQKSEFENRATAVLPAEGILLPIVWGDMGKQMVASGIIDAEKFELLYAERGGLNQKGKNMLYGEENGAVRIGKENAGFLLNLLWAFGLGNKNPILEEGPMNDPRYGGVGNFASTGGWTLARGGVVNHYGAHRFVVLTDAEQEMVERVSQNIYRPCCGNATHFPDCNHGMAMLGLLEIMASQGVSEEEMYKAALAVNAYWFPDAYLTIAEYISGNGVSWNDADPKKILGFAYSSAEGYQRILTEIEQLQTRRGQSCGV